MKLNGKTLAIAGGVAIAALWIMRSDSLVANGIRSAVGDLFMGANGVANKAIWAGGL
ncbi:hypothetical protein ACS5PN_03800 [Roseateles sp. NT4]|uniref:hypothetical protein n=1 Tax=Roseateles sp. NT4 TaxID=3453715 RepID=UPI003EEBF3AC